MIRTKTAIIGEKSSAPALGTIWRIGAMIALALLAVGLTIVVIGGTPDGLDEGE
jgi:hypothetical protein